MNEEKRNRIAAALTVSTVLLTVILVAVIIYQLVTISVISNRRKKLQAEYNYYLTQLENAENDLNYLQSEQYLRDLALQLGYYFPN